MIYTLRLFNIDGLPSYKMVDLFMVMLNNQMVYIYNNNSNNNNDNNNILDKCTEYTHGISCGMRSKTVAFFLPSVNSVDLTAALLQKCQASVPGKPDKLQVHSFVSGKIRSWGGAGPTASLCCLVNRFSGISPQPVVSPFFRCKQKPRVLVKVWLLVRFNHVFFLGGGQLFFCL